MTIEAANYIHELNRAYPRTEDDVIEGDNHIRLIKDVLLNTFPNIKGQITKTHTQLNATPHDASSLTQMLGNAPILVNQANQIPGCSQRNLTFGWHPATGRVRYGSEGWNPPGGLVLDVEFNANRSSIGHQVIVGGICFSWGSFVGVTNVAETPVQFTVAFPVAYEAVFQVFAVPANGNGGGHNTVTVEGFTQTTFSGFVTAAQPGSRAYRWFAVGMVK